MRAAFEPYRPIWEGANAIMREVDFGFEERTPNKKLLLFLTANLLNHISALPDEKE